MGQNEYLLICNVCNDCLLKYMARELTLCGCGEVICPECQNNAAHIFHGSVEDVAYARERKIIINRRLSKIFRLQSIANFFALPNISILLSHLNEYLSHIVISRHDTGIVDDIRLVWWEVSDRPVDYYKNGLSKIFYGRTINEALIFALLYHLERESSDVI